MVALVWETENASAHQQPQGKSMCFIGSMLRNFLFVGTVQKPTDLTVGVFLCSCETCLCEHGTCVEDNCVCDLGYTGRHTADLTDVYVVSGKERHKLFHRSFLWLQDNFAKKASTSVNQIRARMEGTAQIGWMATLVSVISPNSPDQNVRIPLVLWESFPVCSENFWFWLSFAFFSSMTSTHLISPIENTFLPADGVGLCPGRKQLRTWAMHSWRPMCLSRGMGRRNMFNLLVSERRPVHGNRMHLSSWIQR